jgi:hypothetical protein
LVLDCEHHVGGFLDASSPFLNCLGFHRSCLQSNFACMSIPKLRFYGMCLNTHPRPHYTGSLCLGRKPREQEEMATLDTIAFIKSSQGFQSSLACSHLLVCELITATLLPYLRPIADNGCQQLSEMISSLLSTKAPEPHPNCKIRLWKHPEHVPYRSKSASHR